jgi:hypothetical protein
MGTPEHVQPAREVSDPQIAALNYQLELLKMEIDTIEHIIARMDEMTQTTKNWAVVTWAGSIAIALGQPDLRRYTILTAILPFLFWYIDAYIRRLQARSSFRMARIGEFLNDERLVKSFEQRRLIGFTVLDPTGQQYKGTSEYKKYASIWRTLRFREVMVFYLVLVVVGLGLGLFFLLVP